MSKLKSLILVVCIFLIAKSCASYKKEIALEDAGIQNKVNVANILNDISPIFGILGLLVILLFAVTLIISPNKSPSSEKGDVSVPNLQSTNNDNELYNIIAKELISDEKNEGLWLRAFTESKGDNSLTKVRYVELRLSELKNKT